MFLRIRFLFRDIVLCLMLLGLLGIACSIASAASEPRIALEGRHVPQGIARARLVKHVEPDRQIHLAFVLPLRDPQGRADLLRRLYDPADPEYRRFLTAREFAARFAPSLTSVNAVARFAASSGLSVDEIASNRTTITAHGPSSAVERAFQVHLHDYLAQDGTRFRAPDREPTLPESIAGALLDARGFDDLPAASPNLHRVFPSLDFLTALPEGSRPGVSGTGPGGYLQPSDVKTAYSLNDVPATGTGQILALFELDGYTRGDISTYEHRFYPSLPAVPLENVPVDGFNGLPQTTSGASEVTLDIDMMIALAPGASKIIVYEADNTTAGLFAAYNKIASDDVARVVSSSWGLSEIAANYYGQIAPESQIFEQMAAQGQTMFAASGDSGAYGDSWTLVAEDPASQPFVTGVGGTDLAIGGSAGYISESAWGYARDTYGLRPRGQGGGGGVSILQSLPSYQVGTATPGSFVSTAMRNVPDVSLYGDYDTGGYAIYVTDPAYPQDGGFWQGYNGTSAASPLWAGFTALVDQGRALAGRSPIGLLNPAIYAIGKNHAAYARDFHDINDGTTNLYYPAVTGYDLATGWGSFKGASLYADLVSSLTAPTISSFSPKSGGGGLVVTLTGTGFTGTTSVAFNGMPSQSFTVASDGRMTVTVPSGAKTGPITVANAFGTGDSRTSFVVGSHSPIITSITPSSAPSGSVITILGSGFTGTTRVTIGGKAVSFTITGDTKIVFTIPTGAQGGIVDVTTPQGTVESATPAGVPTWTTFNVAAALDGTARILWSRSDGAATVWSVNAADQVTSIGPTYGPYASAGSAWTAVEVATAPDGTSRVLWDRGDGAAGVWTMNAAGAMTKVGPTYGPYVDVTGKWTAYSLTVEADGTSRLLWTRSDNAMGLWTLSASGSVTHVGPVYGPYPDGRGNYWSAIGIAGAGDETARVLWSNGEGEMGIWNFDASDQVTLIGTVYGPISDGGGDWYPISLGVSSDGLSRVLWGRSDGAAGIWSFNASENLTTIGPVYGPYFDFSPYGLGTAGDTSRVLWVRNDRAAGLWTMDGGNRQTLIGPTYGPF